MGINHTDKKSHFFGASIYNDVSSSSPCRCTLALTVFLAAFSSILLSPFRTAGCNDALLSCRVPCLSASFFYLIPRYSSYGGTGGSSFWVLVVSPSSYPAMGRRREAAAPVGIYLLLCLRNDELVIGSHELVQIWHDFASTRVCAVLCKCILETWRRDLVQGCCGGIVDLWQKRHKQIARSENCLFRSFH